MSQAKVFLQGEADAYHRRNRVAYEAYSFKDDIVAQMIMRHELLPSSIVDLGCASGERLSALCAKFAAHGVGIDASVDAIAHAKADKRVDWLVADWTTTISPLSDLIVTSYVWHWVDRMHLLRAMCNVHESLNVGGHLIINDFWTYMLDVPYKHAAGVTTYKRMYDEMFLSTGLYEMRERRKYPYKDSQETAACSLLRRIA